eukprot:scaffold305_cov247-Pinguiococcus_pyrenoidosus.AAC.20
MSASRSRAAPLVARTMSAVCKGLHSSRIASSGSSPSATLFECPPRSHTKEGTAHLRAALPRKGTLRSPGAPPCTPCG